MAAPRSPKVAVIGGGTGSFAVLSALKYYARDITAIVNMADDGGSTGVLRDELGALPPGDIRQCLVALSESDQTMRDLFNYRFEDGGLQGHSFGNLFLSALEKTTGSFAEAVHTAGRVLNIIGRVVPVTLDSVELVLTEADGQKVRGEYRIAQHSLKNKPNLALEPAASLNPDAAQAIAEADLVVIAPGHLYGSLAPALIVPGMAEALQKTSAKLVYIANLVTKPGQTDNFKVVDYVNEIERFIGEGLIDYVIYNQHQPRQELIKKYAQAGEYPVAYDENSLDSLPYRTIGADLVSDTIPKLTKADQIIPRNLIRHDGDKVARLIMRIYFS